MKLSEFILLSEGEKAKTVMCEGVLVAKKKADPTLRFLFQMDSYYVEMYCNRQNKQIEEFRAYTNTVSIQPYLEDIQLNDVL